MSDINKSAWKSIKYLSRDEAKGMPQISPERYHAAKSFEQFVESAVELKDLWKNTARRVQVDPKFVERINKVPGRYKLLALTEDWCLDAVSSVSPVARLAAESSNIEFRLLERDQNLDIMDAHLTNGGRSIPVVILFDESFNELAWWGPRPEELQNWYMETGRHEPMETRYRDVRAWYLKDKSQSTLNDIVSMIENATASSA